MRRLVAPTQLSRQFDALAEQPLDLGFICIRVLLADAFARDVASQLMKTQSDRQPLFASHLTISLNL